MGKAVKETMDALAVWPGPAHALGLWHRMVLHSVMTGETPSTGCDNASTLHGLVLA